MTCFTNRPEPELWAGEMTVLLPRIPLSAVGTAWSEPTCDCGRNSFLRIEPVQPKCMTRITSRIIPSVAQEEELATLDSRAQIPSGEWGGGALVLLQEASFLNPLMSRVGLYSILRPAGRSQCPPTTMSKQGSGNGMQKGESGHEISPHFCHL